MPHIYKFKANKEKSLTLERALCMVLLGRNEEKKGGKKEERENLAWFC